MADNRQQDLSAVQSLLGTRQQLSGWLEKLESAGSKTPPSVRDRVKSDYQGRLAQVVDQLRGHSDVISNSLQGLRTQADEFEGLRSEEQETLAEAELRYSVGEYSDGEWSKVEQDCGSKIGELDQEIGRLGGEIRRLEDVLQQISSRPPAPKAPEPVAVPAPRTHPRAPEPEPVPSPLSLIKDEPAVPEPAPVKEPAEVPEAPRFVPRGGLRPGGRESGPARTLPFPGNPAPPPPSPVREPPLPSVREPAAAAGQGPLDELTFLKSMTIDPPSRSGAQATAEPRASERPSAAVGAKTLKCGECGALNRPTEWYCERCGGELAAV